MAVVAGLASLTVSWHRFDSSTYPYTILQPASFRHVVLPDTENHQVDYYFPPLGSFTTNVNIYAVPGTDPQSERSYLQSVGGHHIKVTSAFHLDGQMVYLYRADFKGIAGQWSIEQATFSNHGYTWRLTLSYAHRYTSMRSTLLRMLQSFHAHG